MKHMTVGQVIPSREYCVQCRKDMVVIEGEVLALGTKDAYQLSTGQGVVKGSFQCRNCGRYYCWDCSDATKPCLCGAENWRERMYVDLKDAKQVFLIVPPSPKYGLAGVIVVHFVTVVMILQSGPLSSISGALMGVAFPILNAVIAYQTSNRVMRGSRVSRWVLPLFVVVTTALALVIRHG